MPAVLAAVLILIFSKPVSLWVIVPAWLFFAYRLGFVRHIHEEEPDGEEGEHGSEEGTKDPENGREGQQPEDPWEEGLTEPRR
jgi:hypothetical protein